jgi:hypothetical protein
MFDTHEFVTTIKSAGATEEQAVLVLKAVSMAIDDMKANRVGKGALIDSKGALTDSKGTLTDSKGASTDSKGTLTDPGLTLIELQADMNRQLANLRYELANLRYELAGVKNLRGILELIFAAIVALIAPLVIIAIAAISKHAL